jgi:hypothetical protein
MYKCDIRETKDELQFVAEHQTYDGLALAREDLQY